MLILRASLFGSLAMAFILAACSDDDSGNFLAKDETPDLGEDSSKGTKYIPPCADECAYGVLEDKRDGRSYRTVSINGKTVMAENLNYSDEGSHSYLIGNNWCYNNDTTNCLKGGRYYTWTAAVDIDAKWQGAALPAGTIKTPHQGICPDGWHIPTADEWSALFKNVEYVAQQAMGNVGWKNATNASGYSALPIGCSKESGAGKNACFWSVTMSSLNKDLPQYWIISAEEAHLHSSGEFKDQQFSVRCFKDDPAE